MELEDGKLYVCRNGEIVRAEYWGFCDEEGYPFSGCSLQDDDDHYDLTSDGKFFTGRDHPWDVIAEYKEPKLNHFKTADGRFFLSADDGVVTIREGQEIQECILSRDELMQLKSVLDYAFEHHTEFVATE